jgi:hypothetical protein
MSDAYVVRDCAGGHRGCAGERALICGRDGHVRLDCFALNRGNARRSISEHGRESDCAVRGTGGVHEQFLI